MAGIVHCFAVFSVGLVLLLIVAIFFRVIKLLFFKNVTQQKNLIKKRCTAKTLIVMGSGGHTGEMIRLLSALNLSSFSPRLYVLAKTDTTSAQHVQQFETSHGSTAGSKWQICRIPRSREVHQSWITTILSAFFSLVHSWYITLCHKPDLVLCNGPGTCVPICIAAFILKTFWIKDVTIVFVESICRVTSLSLTGKIMLYLADSCIVQWPKLQIKYPNTVYLGRLV